MGQRTWEDNAVEFAALSKQGIDIRLGALVACSVEKGIGTGGDPRGSHRNARNDGKVSASRFASRAGTSAPRILRHLDAWNATKGLPSGDDLTPEDVNDIDVTERIIERFTQAFHELTGERPSGGRPRASREEIVERARDDEDYARGLITDLTAAAPKIVAAAVIDDYGASTELLRAQNARAQGRPTGRQPRGGGMVGELQKGVIRIGAMAAWDAAKKLNEALVQHAKECTPWRPKEEQEVARYIDEALMYLQDCKQMITPITDEGLAEFLGQ